MSEKEEITEKLIKLQNEQIAMLTDMHQYQKSRSEKLTKDNEKLGFRISFLEENSKFYYDDWLKIRAENIKLKRKLWRMEYKTNKMKQC
jgi:hypothetical protein